MIRILIVKVLGYLFAIEESDTNLKNLYHTEDFSNKITLKTSKYQIMADPHSLLKVSHKIFV